jgi:hypothetical protein
LLARLADVVGTPPLAGHADEVPECGAAADQLVERGEARRAVSRLAS